MNADAPAGLVISKLTEHPHCNGTYQKTAKQVNGVAAYQQLEDPDKWLCHIQNDFDHWVVQPAANKGQEDGWLYTESVPWEGSTSWKEFHGDSLGSIPNPTSRMRLARRRRRAQRLGEPVPSDGDDNDWCEPANLTTRVLTPAALSAVQHAKETAVKAVAAIDPETSAWGSSDSVARLSQLSEVVDHDAEAGLKQLSEPCEKANLSDVDCK